MARGQYLRTNYRITGGILDITAIGGGYPTAAAQAGAGDPRPYGGFIFITSYCTSIGGSTKVAGYSNWIVDSTYGILSWFFTSLSPGSGYKFLPLRWNFRSISDTRVGACGEADGLIRIPIYASMTLSSSFFGLLFGKATNFAGAAGTGSLICLISYSGQEVLLDLWGFIVSAP